LDSFPKTPKEVKINVHLKSKHRHQLQKMQIKHTLSLHTQEENKHKNIRDQQKENRSVKQHRQKKSRQRRRHGKMPIPTANDVLGIAVKLLGFDRIMVKCQDGHERLCRIRGKMKRRVWIRVGDIVLVSPWDFQSDT
jgi:translation initiation factor 1A